MKFCQRCGAKMNDTDKFCTSCGLPCGQAVTPWQPTYPTQPSMPAPFARPVQPKKENNALPYFILGLLLFIVINPIGTPFSAIGVIFATIANSAECENPKDKLDKARIFLIAAACVDALTILTSTAVWLIEKIWL